MSLFRHIMHSHVLYFYKHFANLFLSPYFNFSMQYYPLNWSYSFLQIKHYILVLLGTIFFWRSFSSFSLLWDSTNSFYNKIEEIVILDKLNTGWKNADCCNWYLPQKLDQGLLFHYPIFLFNKTCHDVDYPITHPKLWFESAYKLIFSYRKWIYIHDNLLTIFFFHVHLGQDMLVIELYLIDFLWPDDVS